MWATWILHMFVIIRYMLFNTDKEHYLFLKVLRYGDVYLG